MERKLQHLRSWMASVNAHMATTNPQLVKNARRLYVGGVPPGTTEVRARRRGPEALSSRGHARPRLWIGEKTAAGTCH